MRKKGEWNRHKQKYALAMSEKIKVWKPTLAERALTLLEMLTKHELGEISDYELAVHVYKRFPVAIIIDRGKR